MAPVQAGVGAGAGASVGAPATRETAPAAVVGLDTEAPEQGAALTRALRKAFAARGLSGGEEVNLSELRLALGCKRTSPECLAKGGALVGARRLIYGTLRRDGGAWVVEVTLVEAEGGAAITIEETLRDADLAADRIDGTAEALADRLAPDTAVASAPAQSEGGLASPPPPPEPVEPADGGDEAADDEVDAGTGKLRWGYVRPQPRWKWIGFGVSAGVTVATGAAAIGMTVWLTSKTGGFRGKLVDAASASLTDANPLNDVDPNLPEGVNLCDYARASSDPTMPERVRNAAVTKVCNDADTIRKQQIATGITSAIGLVATAAFTFALLVHRGPARASTWQRHGLQVGVDPATRGQGLSLRVAGRF